MQNLIHVRRARPAASITRLRHALILASAFVLSACSACEGGAEGASAAPLAAGTGAGATSEGSAPSAEEAEGSGEGSAQAEGSGDSEGSAEPEFVSLWIGLYCNATDERHRTFSFYLDGREIQRLETQCNGSATPPDERPNGGQFHVPVRRGVQLLRIQDDTHDYFSEYEIAVPGDHWVFVDHKVLPGNTGHLTSTLNWFVPPSFAF